MDSQKISQSEKSSVHEVLVNNIVYREFKGEATGTRDGEDVTIVTHSREIGDKKYEVVQVCKGEEVLEENINASGMTETEIEDFVNDWKENFKPVFTDNE